MTNGPGKSDRPTVPGKSPNNARQPAAEGMEGKGLAKGNLLEQNASRTPSRKDAPSALERVRQAAKKDKQLRFTALLHHIYNPETLRVAYFSLKKEAAPGVDGETWRHYGEELERNLDRKSTRLNSSHGYISYAVFCLKKKKTIHILQVYGTLEHPHALSGRNRGALVVHLDHAALN